MVMVVEREWHHSDLSDGNHHLEAATFTISLPEITHSAVQVNNCKPRNLCDNLSRDMN